MDRGTGRTIEILERDGAVVSIVARTATGETLEIMATLARAADVIILSELHVDGPGSGTLGAGGIGELRALARLFLTQEGAQTLIIKGGTRTTGAGAAALRTPRDIVIRIT
jgi:hypothetical protein